ncbi:MAG: CAP domain-containing protein [Gammaproteobacteria bacterium]|nr:CAP domain-containing protein [Gammaproteobacteria bacterium]
MSDYINSRKIAKAPVYKEPPKTSQCDFSELRIQRVLGYINALRSQSRVCSEKSHPAAPALTWNNKLSLAALTHSNDMAKNNFFDHNSSLGLSASERVSNTGYNWKTVAENIAAGTDTPEQTLDQWMTSPEHCHNIMNSAHKEIGLACTRNNLSDFRVYWTLVLASPN